MLPARPSSTSPARRLRLLLGAWLLLLAAAVAAPLWAGSTGDTDLHMPQGSGAGGANGDDVTDDGGMDTVYRYWIEVPPGLSRLVVQIFDPDIGGGGGGEAADQRDRARDGFNTDADYYLFRPNGTQAASLLNCDDNTCDADDDDWDTILDSTTATNTAAGHWELRVDMSDAATTGNDINAIGIRAHDNNSGSGGTELNVYYDSFASFGVNPPTSGQNVRDYDIFPYITSGCSARKSDFDWDSNNGDTGGVVLASRTGSFTQTYDAGVALMMSGNNAWLSNSFTGWTSDQISGDYGIWNADVTITSYLSPGQNGNYGHVYFTDFNHDGSDPTTNPEDDAFRVYLGTDAGANVAPTKPYLEQLLTHKSGPNPVPVGQTSRFQVTVRLVNPTTRSITFSTPSNVVTSNVPGSGAVYAGNDAISQGTLVSEPSVGGTGNVVWNPGTVTAGSTVLLTYQVDVTPTSAGQRIPVTGTPASNGTRAQHVDETGNTTQTRATYLLGPICELATTQGVLTEAMVSSFKAFPGGNGGIELEWTTASEVGTAGFYLHRWDAEARRWRQVNENLLAAVVGAPQGGRYRFVDSAVRAIDSPVYRLEEVEGDGRRRMHGPFPVAVDWERRGRAGLEGEYEASAHVPTGRVPAAERHTLTTASRAVAEAKEGDKRGRSVHVSVDEAGLQYLSSTNLAPFVDLSAGTIMQRIAQGKVLLTRNGQPVAWHPQTGGAGLFFYGETVDSLYTEAGVYKLQVGGNGLTMEVSGVGGAGGNAADTFADTRRLEDDVLAATVLGLDPESDYWFWEFMQGGDPTFGDRTFAFDAPAADPAAAVTLALDLQGATASGFTDEHEVDVTLNGVALGEARFTGITPHRVELAVPSGTLLPTGNQLELVGSIGGGAPFSIVYLEGFDVGYQRHYEAADDGLELAPDGHTGITVTGLSSSLVRLLDVSDALRPRWLEGAVVAPGSPSGFQASFAPDGGARYLAAGPGAIHTPALRPWTAEQLRPNRRRDYLVVAPKALAAAAQRLADLREDQGLLAEVVTLEEVYDQYGGGQPTPHALRTFLTEAAAAGAKKAPSYVVLAGEGTLDYRDLRGFGENLLPPIMVVAEGGLFPADNRFTDIEGDGLPEVAIGRIPVLTNAELDAYVDKIAAYEAANGAVWAGNVLMLADAPQDGTAFGDDSVAVAQQLPGSHTAAFVDLGAMSLGDARTQLFTALDQGAALVNYLGHGGLDRLAAPGLLTNADVAGLTNGERLPVITAMTCTVNRFSVPGVPSLGELLVKHPDGGAAAVLGPSGLSFHPEARGLAERLYRRSSDLGGERLGDLILGAYREYFERGGDPGLLNIYNLLGDPALKVVMPPPPPPVGGSSGE